MSDINKVNINNCKIIYQRYGGKKVGDLNKQQLVDEILNFSNNTEDWKKFLPNDNFNYLAKQPTTELRKLFSKFGFKYSNSFTKYKIIDTILETISEMNDVTIIDNFKQ